MNRNPHCKPGEGRSCIFLVPAQSSTTQWALTLGITDVLCQLSPVWLFVTTWTVGLQVSLSVGFSQRECWSGLPFPFPGDLPDPGTEPASPASAGGFLTTEPPGKRFCKIVALQTCSAPLLLRMLGCSKTKVIYDSSYLEFNTSRISSCPCECSLACEEKKVT